MRVGLIGAGNVAQMAQLPALATRPDVTLAGLVTRTPESAEANLRRWPIERTYSTVDEMLESAALDAIFVLSPRRAHAEAVRLALAAGVDVYSEKPLASTAAEARGLADLASSSGRLLMVNFNRRFSPLYLDAKRVFTSAPPQFVVAQKNRAGTEYRATFENAIHMIDLLRWFCGEAESVQAQARTSDAYFEDGVVALIRFAGGSIASLTAVRTAGVWDERIELYGADQTVRVVAPDYVEIARDGSTSKTDMRAAAFGWVQARQTLGFQAAVEHFLDHVSSRAPVESDGYSAAQTQELVECILRASQLPTQDAEDFEWSSRASH
jgi:virulence factor